MKQLPPNWPFETPEAADEYEKLRAESFAAHAQAHALFMAAHEARKSRESAKAP